MLLKEFQKYNLIEKLLLFLIITYLLTIPFGMVFKSFEDRNDFFQPPLINLSFLSYAIIIAAFFSIKRIKVNSIFTLFFIFIFYLLVVTFFFSNNFTANLLSYFSLTGNILLAFFISNINFKRSTIRYFFWILALTTFLSSAFTILDFSQILDIPYFNEKSSLFDKFDVMWVSGPFPRRTAMGSFYSVILPILLLSFIYYKKYIYIFSLFFSFVAMLITLNRGAPFSLFIIFIIFIFRRYSFTLKKFVLLSFTIIILVVITFQIIPKPYKDAIAYKVLATLNIVEKSDSEKVADNLRIEVLKQIITEDLINNPFGYSFNDFYFKKRNISVSVHSNLSYILFSAGFIGLIWLLVFLRKLYRYSLKINSNELVIIKYSLFSWALYSLTHTTINTFLAWLFLGILLNRNIQKNQTMELQSKVSN